jgi:hypothetical protein
LPFLPIDFRGYYFVFAIQNVLAADQIEIRLILSAESYIRFHITLQQIRLNADIEQTDMMDDISCDWTLLVARLSDVRESVSSP